MDQKTDNIIKDYIAAAAAKFPRIAQVYLFGSYAKESENQSSDIDIAFIIKDIADDEKFDLQVQLILIASDFDMRIEPHILSEAEFHSWYPLSVEIRKTGIELKLPHSRELSQM